MTVKQVISELKALGTAQNRKIYRRHGVMGQQFGVSYANLGKLSKTLGKDSELARGLWASANHDARVLACMLADSTDFKANELDVMCRELDNYVITDAFSGLAARCASANARMKKWCGAKGEWVSAAGWNMVCSAAGRSELDDTFFIEQIELIENTIHASKNRTRHSMNQALICIGLRGPQMRKAAVAAAKRIGKVEVDHGATSCKTPEVEDYIAKTLAHRKTKKK
ncbi:DNA alkylation repair protein [bacterium]|nr:DNA alkylation repair protein [bacterium]